MEYKGVNDSTIHEKQNMQIEGNDVDDTWSEDDGLYDELFNNVAAQNEEEQLLEISNEVDKYLADEIEKRSNLSLLFWSSENEIGLGTQSCHFLPKIYLQFQVTVASESAFSLGKRIVDLFRSNLSQKMVEALVCTNDWLKTDDLNLYKDPTDDDLDLYEEIEKSKSFYYYLSLN